VVRRSRLDAPPSGTVLNIFFIANAIVYGGLKFPHIFGIEDAGRQKYEKNLLSEAEKEHYGRKLLEFMETRKPYLEPTLSLSDLATQLQFLHTCCPRS